MSEARPDSERPVPLTVVPTRVLVREGSHVREHLRASPIANRQVPHPKMLRSPIRPCRPKDRTSFRDRGSARLGDPTDRGASITLDRALVPHAVKTWPRYRIL